MNIFFVLFACLVTASAFLVYQSVFALLEIPSLNESDASTDAESADMIALKMKFGDKQEGVLDMLIYSLKDQNFVVSNNSEICPDQNCKFEFKDTDMAYQPGSNRITLDGQMKVKTGDVTKINKFYADFSPIQESEQNGLKTEIVQGTFGFGQEPVNGAEIEYNVNGTLESEKGGKILSLQGIRCNGINNDDSKVIDCNY